MASLASRIDLAKMPGFTAGEYSDDQLDMALELATADVIADLGWDPRQSERTLALRCTGARVPIVLPAWNVTAVAATVDGSALDSGSIDWTTPAAILYLTRAVSRSGMITYTAGWADEDMPDAIRLATLRAALDGTENPTRLRTWRVENVTETSGTTTAERGDPLLDPYRLGPTLA